jgi:lipopolysaccharide export system protein LptC
VTLEAEFAPAGQRYRVRTPQESERAFRAAARHSRWVALLRKALPALALTVFAGYFITSRLSVTVGGVTASVSGVEVKDGMLRMVKPTLKGVDKKQGAYVVNADYADQDMKNPKLVRLHAIKAELSTQAKGWSRLEAVRGIFDSGSERLVMQDDIRVSTSSGLAGKLTYATLDTQSQIIRSHVPVAFDLPNGSVRASAMTLNSKAKTLTFRGKVRVHIKKVGKDEPSKQAGATTKKVGQNEPSKEGGAATKAPEVKAPDLPAKITPPQAGAAPAEASPR